MGNALSGELSCPCDRSCLKGNNFVTSCLLLWTVTLSKNVVYFYRKEFAPGEQILSLKINPLWEGRQKLKFQSLSIHLTLSVNIILIESSNILRVPGKSGY